MLWVIFALISPLLWSINGIVNKFMISKITKSTFSFYILSTFVQTIVVILAVLFFPLNFDFNYILLSIISGMIGSGAFLTFLFALEVEDTSKVVPLTYISNIFIIILAFVFLNESFHLSKYFGIALILSGSFILSYKKTKGKHKVTPALGFILLNTILFATSTVLNKIILSGFDFWSLFSWGMIGANMLAISLFIKKKIRKDFVNDLKIKKRQHLIILINSLFGMGGLMTYFVALSLGPATLVSSMGAITPLLTLILTVFLSLFFPHIIQEQIDKRSLTIKVLCTFLIIIGAIIIVL